LIELGDEIEGDIHGMGEWLPGVVKRKREEGTFDIQYDNGLTEICKYSNELRFVRSRIPRTPANKNRKKCPNNHYFSNDYNNNNNNICFVTECELCETTEEVCTECGFVTYHINCDHQQILSEISSTIDNITTTVSAADSLLALNK
jgi:hypothetical protein